MFKVQLACNKIITNSSYIYLSSWYIYQIPLLIQICFHIFIFRLTSKKTSICSSITHIGITDVLSVTTEHFLLLCRQSIIWRQQGFLDEGIHQFQVHWLEELKQFCLLLSLKCHNIILKLITPNQYWNTVSKHVNYFRKTYHLHICKMHYRKANPIICIKSCTYLNGKPNSEGNVRGSLVGRVLARGSRTLE